MLPFPAPPAPSNVWPGKMLFHHLPFFNWLPLASPCNGRLQAQKAAFKSPSCPPSSKTCEKGVSSCHVGLNSPSQPVILLSACLQNPNPKPFTSQCQSHKLLWAQSRSLKLQGTSQTMEGCSRKLGLLT